MLKPSAIGDPAGDSILARPVDRNLRSMGILKQAQAWLRECVEGRHPNCPLDHTVFQSISWPSRLIKLQHDVIGEIDAVQLINCDQNHSGAYAALSYCWGSQQTFVTTTANFQDMLRSIRLADLPQSIQDAILVARSIGLDYLWVDALCIIQDSEDDKVKEIIKMGQIYRNAAVTITADRAADCRDGFLGDTRPNVKRIAKSVSSRIPYRALSGRLGSVLLRKLHIVPPNSYLSQPIHRRAWTYQESFFAQRMLSFGDQLHWQCPSGHDIGFGMESDVRPERDLFYKEDSDEFLLSNGLIPLSL